MNRIALALLFSGALVWAAPVMAAGDNSTALNFDGEFAASDEDLDKDGLLENSMEVEAEAGDNDVDIDGEVAVEAEDGSVVVFKYELQELNKLTRKAETLSAKQDDGLEFEICFCDNVTEYDEDDCEDVEVGAVSGCSAKVKLDDSDVPATVKAKVTCKNLDPVDFDELDEAQLAKLEEILDGDGFKIKLNADEVAED